MLPKGKVSKVLLHKKKKKDIVVCRRVVSKLFFYFIRLVSLMCTCTSIRGINFVVFQFFFFFRINVSGDVCGIVKLTMIVFSVCTSSFILRFEWYFQFFFLQTKLQQRIRFAFVLNNNKFCRVGVGIILTFCLEKYLKLRQHFHLWWRSIWVKI